MANAYKVLGQSAPAATTSTDVYTVPSSTEAVVSSITMCNRGTNSGDIRISIRPNGATLANEHYLVYDATVVAADTVVLTVGITLDAADVVTVYASSADFSFHVYGTEITA